MKLLRYALTLALIGAAVPVLAQSPITELSGSTYHEKVIYAVYDLRGTNLNVEVVESIVLDAIKLYARNARVQEGIPPASYPGYPAQMTIGQRPRGGPKADCAGELFSIEGVDSSMAKYGESTYHRACLFPYAGGYRINYFARFGMQSGVGSANPNVISGMLGRVMAGAVGLGNSSSFINKILERMENNLKEKGFDARLVQLHPKTLEGRVLVTDELSPPPVATASVSAQQQPVLAAAAPPSVMAPAMAAQGPAVQPGVPPQLAQMREIMMRQTEAARQQMAANGQAPTGGAPAPRGSAAEARKELTAMGLQYFSQEQFLAAIRRGDTLAVELFIAGTGVDINAGEAGKTPVALAENTGRPEIAALLKSRGAR